MSQQAKLSSLFKGKREVVEVQPKRKPGRPKKDKVEVRMPEGLEAEVRCISSCPFKVKLVFLLT